MSSNISFNDPVKINDTPLLYSSSVDIGSFLPNFYTFGDGYLHTDGTSVEWVSFIDLLAQIQAGLVLFDDHGDLTGLGDDDHTQYLNTARVDTWLNGKSTTDLTEGTNLYYTETRVNAITEVSTAYSHSQVVTGNPHDVAWNQLTGVSPIITDHGVLSGLSDDDHTQYLNTTRVNTWLNGKSTTDLTEGTNLYYTEARVNANTNVTANTSSRHIAATINTGNGLSISGQAISLSLSSDSTAGALSSSDWTTFNNKVTFPGFGTLMGDYGYDITGVQPLNANLTNIVGVASEGILTKLAGTGWASRSIIATTPIAISNGNLVNNNAIITHATSGVLANTYKSVTVNTYGHVTAGTNPTTLSGYGITDAMSSDAIFTFSDLEATPTTLVGYGITDAASLSIKSQVITANFPADALRNGYILECTNSPTITLPNGLVNGYQIAVVNMGTGIVTIAATTTLNTKDGKKKLANQYGAASFYHQGSNVWVGFGDLST